MSVLAGIVMPLAAGAALGAVYFGGLWLTLRRLPSSRRPATLVMGSYVARLAVCLAGLYLVSLGGHWQRLALALAAMIAVRMALVRVWGESRGRTAAPLPKGRAAPERGEGPWR